jgi:hypothetical protein
MSDLFFVAVLLIFFFPSNAPQTVTWEGHPTFSPGYHNIAGFQT